MKVAYSTNAYRRCSVEEAVDRIAALGFAGIELMADRPHLWPPDTSEQQAACLRNKIRTCGLQISNLNAFMMSAVEDFHHPSWIEPDPDYRRLRIEHTKASLALASALGARCITTEPGGPLPEGMPRDDAMGIFISGLNEALREAERIGVRLLVEPEPGLLIETADQFLELAERINSPAFGLNFDIGHFYCVADPLPETVCRLALHTRHYHLEDIAASRVHEHLIPGHGALDFRAVFDAIRSTHYDGWITVELYPYLDDPDAAGRESLEFLQSLLAATGNERNV